MKNILYTTLGFLLLLPTVSMAAPGTVDVGFFENFLANISGLISSATSFFLFLAFALFIWGLIKFLIISGHDEEARSQGKSLMIWGIVAFFLISAIWGIVNVIQGVIGADDNSYNVQVPKKVT